MHAQAIALAPGAAFTRRAPLSALLGERAWHPLLAHASSNFNDDDDIRSAGSKQWRSNPEVISHFVGGNSTIQCAACRSSK